MLKKILLVLPLIITSYSFAQDENADSSVEEVVVVGSQIKGAKITGALPVTVISSDDIEGLGIDSGEDLLENIAENGQNTYNQTDSNGGYNASRGDVGALNLRNLGTGNTLTLLNGRRVVNSPGYQTEVVGGSFVPVITANSNTIPVYGADRVEILRDGASAIYGADAVGGVFNTVLKDDFEGLTLRFRTMGYENWNAEDDSLSVQWGKDFGNTNVSVYYDMYARDKITSDEDPRWHMTHHQDLCREAAPGLGVSADEFCDNTWRNGSANNAFWQFYNAGSSASLNGGNIFSMYRITDDYCTRNSSSNEYNLPGYENEFCIYDASSTRQENRFSFITGRDKRSELDRHNLFVFINTELDSGVTAYTEIGFYDSKSHRGVGQGTINNTGSSNRGGGGVQSTFIPASNYWLSQLVRLNGDTFLDRENSDGLWMRYGRFQMPRDYTSRRQTKRIVQGFSGQSGNWDWDTAVVLSQATSMMYNGGRKDMTALDAALADSTPNAFNPFCNWGSNCNEEQFTMTIFRENSSDLYMWDLKMSNPEVFTLPNSLPVAMLIGGEIRREKLRDIRDPNINGTIPYVENYGVYAGRTYPYTSNVVGSSPSPNTSGSRTTTSLFTEFQIPLSETVSSQFAVRAENADDFGGSVVGKFAIGWDATDNIKMRASTSSAFRAPNLVTVNEGMIARVNSRNDSLISVGTGSDYPNYSMQRIAMGNDQLEAEESTTTSLGIVLTPVDNLVITYDIWKVEIEKTVGLFGEENHVLLDTLIRVQGGVDECVGNPRVVRSAYVGHLDDDTGEALPWSSALCPAGQVTRIDDIYANLDDRTLEGSDILIDYRLDTDIGDFRFKLSGTFYDKMFQEASSQASEIIAATQPGGILDLDGVSAPQGFANLLGTRGQFEEKYTSSISYRKGPYSARLTGTYLGEWLDYEVNNNSSGGDGNTLWPMDSMLTMNLTLGYSMDNGMRVRFIVTNIEDTRAPLYDDAWLANSDVHNDLGRKYTFEVLKKF